MRKIVLLLGSFAALVSTANAQTVATFDSLSLPATDTYYVNYSMPGMEVGFNSGLAHFPCIYDSSFGAWFFNGFIYSDKTDSVTCGYANEASAKTGIGYGGSANYGVLYCSNPITYANNFNLNLFGAAVGKPVSGFYVTNSTYAYNSFTPGYPAPAFGRKFHTGDWFLLTIKGYSGGMLTADSVNFYLADYRDTDTTMHYGLKTWEWVNLLPLGHVDSLQFSLSSTDTGAYGMNTPAYFCMDNLTTNETLVGVQTVNSSTYAAKIYPNPSSGSVFIETPNNDFNQITVLNAAGTVVLNQNITTGTTQINTQGFASGNYLVQFTGANAQAHGWFTIAH